jgi:putative addiction module component (TIGR02574 family)
VPRHVGGIVETIASGRRRSHHRFVEPNFEQMSPAERIEYLQDLWDRVAEDPLAVPVTDAQRAELRRRVAAYRADPTSGVPWEQVMERARGR